MPLFAPAHPSLVHTRAFSCTANLLAKSTKQRLAHEHSKVPPYPYGASLFYKQSNFGLYGTQKIRYGNMVSEKNEIKTRRYWRPNVHSKRLWSHALGRYVKTRITTRVLRTVDKVGGLDEYLLGDKAGRIKALGMAGWKMRWRIMQTKMVKERFRLQREMLGLPPKEEVLVSSSGLVATEAQVEEEMRQFDEELARDEGISIEEETEGPSAEDVAPEFMQEEPVRSEKVNTL